MPAHAQPYPSWFVGRRNEIETLDSLLRADGPGVMHVYGIAGIGKTSLLEAFAARARTTGAALIRLDCRDMEPTAGGFLQALGEALNRPCASVATAVDQLGKQGSTVVVMLDTFEVYRLMDTWLRQHVVPQLPANTRLLCLGRERPPAAWRTAAGVRSLALGPLDHEDAGHLLQRAGLPERPARRIARGAHGHPLALQLAAAAYTERPDLALQEQSLQQALEALTRMYLADVKDPTTRQVLEACAVLRRVTLSLLQALLPDLSPEEAYTRLRALPFTDEADDGLLIHDAVRTAIARSLRARDPHHCRGYQQAARGQLLREARAAGRSELWRYTADMLYLIENPVVREAFFPSGTQTLVVEPATRDDTDAITTITRTHEQSAAADQLLAWWHHRPDSFVVARDSHGQVAGFCSRFFADQMDPDRMHRDPLTACWLEHLQHHPLPAGQRALFCRRWLSAEHGETPSDVQAALWLDLKRTYMELRPSLRRVYLAVEDLAAYAPAATRLGFQVLDGAEVDIGDTIFHSAVLDFGPASVDGWLAELVAVELGINEPVQLDIDARELVVNGIRIALTPLEFGVMQSLQAQRGNALSRSELLRQVWNTDYTGGSNVVDTVVRGLRRKLGDHAGEIETVTGTGYRLRDPDGPELFNG